MQIKCDKCGYTWDTNSKMHYVSCPSCIQKVKNPNAQPNSEPNTGDSSHEKVGGSSNEGCEQ